MSEYKPIVGIDMDGVVSDYVKAYLSICRGRYSRPARGYIQQDWHFNDTGLTKGQLAVCSATVDSTENFWLELDKMPDTGSLRRRQDEFNLFFITNRKPTAGMSTAEQTAEWLFNNYLIDSAYVEVTETKGPACKSLGIEFFIDDKPENLIDVRKECGDAIFLALQDASYNREWDGSRWGVRRVNSLDEFLEWVKPAEVAGGDARSREQQASSSQEPKSRSQVRRRETQSRSH